MDQKLADMVTGTVRCFFAAISLTAVLLLVFSLLLWKTGLPEQYLSLYTLVSCAAGSAASGYGGGRVMKQKGMIWGASYGILYLVLLMILLFLFTGGEASLTILRPHWPLCIAISALSGMFSVNLRKE